MSYLAAFRAYDWDETVDELAVRYFHACPGGHHVVLVDESRGVVPVPPRYLKLSRDEGGCARLGAPCSSSRSFALVQRRLWVLLPA